MIADYNVRRLPRSTQGRLEEFVHAIEGAWGANLVGVVLFGSVARGEWREGRSDVDVAVVARKIGPAELAAVSDAVAVAEAAIHLDAMFLEEAEIQRSSDVWPLLFRDVCEHRVVLSGKDVFADVEVREDHAALAIEQELREALRTLRRNIIDTRGDHALLGARVDACLRKVRVPLRALLRADGVDVSHALSMVIAKGARKFRLDSVALEHARDRPARAGEELLELLGRAVTLADARGSQADLKAQ